MLGGAYSITASRGLVRLSWQSEGILGAVAFPWGKSMAGRPQLARALDWDGLQNIKAVIDVRAAIKVLDRSYIASPSPWAQVHGDDVGHGRG
jgi:hypothetical protein